DEIADAPALRQTFDDLEREGRLTTLALGPLSRLDTVALVVAFGRLGDDAAVDRLGERAWAASEGNPFVAVETVRAHAENTWVAHAGGLALPERVREIVGRRLERLSERTQSLAAVAAVIGRGFEFALLQRAAGLSEEETAAGVEELVRRRVLQGQGERFDFTHDRVRDVAWSRMLAPRRKLIHRRVAEGIEALYAGNLGSHALALGLHYRDAEVWDHAARHLHMAGCAARDHAANREAVASFDAALECLRNLPDDRMRSERLVDTIIEQEAALMGLGEFQRSLAGLREAEAIARALGDRLRLGWIFGRFAYNLGSIGDLDAAIEHAEQARHIGIEVDDARCHVSSNVVLARARYARGDYREAMEAVRENDELARRRTRGLLDGHALRNSPFSRIWGVLALAELGEFAEAIVQGEEALRESAAFGSHPVVWAHLGVGRLYLVKGDFAQAIELLERGLPLCEAAGDLAVYFSRTAASLGGAYAQSGRLDEALALLERADRHAESIGFAYGHALVIATLAEAKLLAGEIDEAARIADRALTRSRQHGQRGWEAWARRLQGQIATHGDPLEPGVGERHFRVAMELARERGMQPLIAHCHAGLAKLFQRTGDRSELDQHVTAATAMYRAMGMTSWVEKTEAELQV
ncbi:MAG: hypothetical protein DMD81_04385, partial [Candidatus Rokuibacteriota bacterium]